MLEGLRLTKEQLKVRFGCTERLAVRVGALRAHGVDLTAAVMEEAARSPAVGRVLLAAELLAKAGALDTSAVHAIGPDAAVLSVVAQGGRRIIALGEETLAERAWEEEKGPVSALSVAQTSVAIPAAGLRFSPEDVAQIRMTLLTGVDARAKIEALRKLVYAPLEAGERGVLALRALTDAEADVRQEAAAALERLGLHGEFSDALRTVASGTPRQKTVALQKIASMSGVGTPSERAVVLAMLVASLSYEKDTLVLRALLETLANTAELVAAHPEVHVPALRNLVKIVVDRFEDLAPAGRAFLGRVGARGDEAMAAAFWREIEGVDDRRLKVFFLEAVCGMRVPADLRVELCTRVAREVAAVPIDDLATRRLADALRALGEPALRALLSVVGEAREENRAALVPLIDDLASGDGVSREARNEAGECLAALLREGSRAVRAAIIEARCCWHPQLDLSIKRKLAADFMGNLHAVQAPRLHDLTAAAVRRMGLGVAEALQQCLTRSAHAVERAAAAAALADVAAEAKSGKEIDAIIRLLRKQENGRLIPIGRAMRCVGRAASSAGASPELVMEIYEDYWKRLGSVSYAFDVLVAVARLAAGPGCRQGAAVQVTLKLLDCLDAPMPEPTMSERETEDGKEFVLGAQTAVYTDFIPELIAGLRGLSMSGRLHEGARKMVVERLCAKYRLLAEYREIWAPGNIVDLANALADIASTADAPLGQRLRVIETLLENVRSITMVRILARVCRRPEEESKMHAALVGQYARRCVEMLAQPEYQEPEDRRAIIESLGRIATNRLLGESKKESDVLRARIVDLLVEHRDTVRDARGMLREIAGCERAARSLRRRIEEIGS
ncbi:MAG: hypothetical protein HYY16_14000 [Planctomycetes bacterium]|nr:hypothetical protein [Planctomycetota bacterium]